MHSRAPMTCRYELLVGEVGYIRHVVIQPAEESRTVIEFTVGCMKLARVEYNALSYTWGGADDKQPISLSGEALFDDQRSLRCFAALTWCHWTSLRSGSAPSACIPIDLQ